MSGRFYFDLDNGTETIADESGVEAATAELAVAGAMEVIAEIRANGQNDGGQNWALVIRDAEGSTVKCLPIR